MKRNPVTGIRVFLGILLALGSTAPSSVLGQDVGPGVRDAFFRALGEHFELPVEEVAIVGSWQLDPDEIPVVLFLSQRAGVPPDALIGLRKRGHSWQEIGGRFGLGVQVFFIPLPQDGPMGTLTRIYGEFRSKPSSEWNEIELNDNEALYLVNLRVLSEQIGVPPLRVLESREEAGSFLGAFASLLGRDPF